MRNLLISLDPTSKNKVQALCEALRLSIRQGKLKPGERLPSSRAIAEQLRINRQTVLTAFGELEAEGWIESFEKRFYMITQTLPDTFLTPKGAASARGEKSAKEKSVRFARPVDLPLFPKAQDYEYSFPSGFPDLRLFPMKEFKSHLYDSLKIKDILTYGDPAGHPHLLEEIETYLRRVRGVASRKIIVTNGSQEAIFLLAQSLISPGDEVAVEELGYAPSWHAMRFAGAKLIGIRVDQEGLSVDDLEEKLKRHKIKFLYVTPLHQYPTTVTLSASRRLRLYELALKHGIFIIEDDYDHEFHYQGQPVAPMASFDPAGIVLYISTFSKILFPSARVGFMSVPQNIAEQVTQLKRMSSRQNEHILQASIALWMKSGGFEKHLRKMRRTYAERCRQFAGDLEVHREKFERLRWVVPDGGMALWLNLGQNTSKLAKKLKDHSIMLLPESLYRLDQKEGTHARMGFTGFTPKENQFALRRLFSEIAKK
jgi:GntR family transcriptional regulator / MocR family aminotransferase